MAERAVRRRSASDGLTISMPGPAPSLPTSETSRPGNDSGSAQTDSTSVVAPADEDDRGPCGLCRRSTLHREDADGNDLGRCPIDHGANRGRQPTPAGMERAASGTDAWFASSAEQALVELIRIGHRWTSDALFEMGVPRPDNGNRVGAFLAQAARDGRIVKVGYRPSPRPSRAGGVTAVWQGRRDR